MQTMVSGEMFSESESRVVTLADESFMIAGSDFAGTWMAAVAEGWWWCVKVCVCV